MSKIFKNTVAAIVTSGLLLGAVAPMTVDARPYSQTQSCVATKTKDKNTGMILGAIAGGLIGSQAAKHEKGLGLVAGALAGGVVGSKLGKDHGKQTCNNVENAMQDARYEHRGYHPYTPARRY
jgi:uncharacterized membrane protein